MFSKGSRFVPQKPSETPGPNAYDPNTESLEEYKKGAFLESADRFAKEKPSEIPGPTSSKYGTNVKANGAPKPSQAQANDRLAALQRRVDELERVHSESKKIHQTEVERLKAELARAQKSNSDLTDRLEKSKKHNELFEGKHQELRKANLSDQAEIKDLRVKLKLSEHERSQLLEKQEKLLAAERKKREAAEQQCQTLRGKGDSEVKEMRTTAQSLEARLKEAQEETKKALGAASDERQAADAREAELLGELERHRALLQRVAQEYGRLASSTVAMSTHARLKRDHIALQLHATRLERKLSNSEAQVVELAHLIRNVKLENSHLRNDLLDIEQDMAILLSPRRRDVDLARDSTLENLCSVIDREARILNEATLTAFRNADRSLHDFYTLSAQKIKHAYLLAEIDLAEAYGLSNRLKTALTAASSSRVRLESEVESYRTQIASSQQVIEQTKAELTKAVQKIDELETKWSEADTRSAADAAKLKQEKASVQRLTQRLTEAKETEKVLQSELEQMSTDLAEAERYQQAYSNLYELVADLAARNELAESEAEKLSKFNAEIIGHANPAQRIMYLERIRAELADTKHQLLTMTIAHEEVCEDNETLRQELDLYKGVTTHPKEKIRTNVTRVHRVPLTNLTQSADSQRSLNPTK